MPETVGACLNGQFSSAPARLKVPKRADCGLNSIPSEKDILGNCGVSLEASFDEGGHRGFRLRFGRWAKADARRRLRGCRRSRRASRCSLLFHGPQGRRHQYRWPKATPRRGGSRTQVFTRRLSARERTLLSDRWCQPMSCFTIGLQTKQAKPSLKRRSGTRARIISPVTRFRLLFALCRRCR